MFVSTQFMHALLIRQGWQAGRGISSSDFIQLKCDKEPTLNPREKY